MTPARPLDPEEDRRRLVRALVWLVTRLAAARPVLVIVEDLHWGDDASLEALLALARRVADLPIALLLTYRSDETGSGLGHALALLERERLATEIALGRLSPADVDAMLRAIFDQPRPIRADFLHALYDLTDGNPFFIEEVVRALIAAGDIFRTGGRWERRSLAQLRIPRSVQDAVLRRVRTLSPEAGRVLHLAAVAGRSFDFAILQALTGRDERDLLELFRELVAAQLVVVESAERFTFRHALTRQAIYATLLIRERRALRLTVARAAGYGDPCRSRGGIRPARPRRDRGPVGGGAAWQPDPRGIGIGVTVRRYCSTASDTSARSRRSRHSASGRGGRHSRRRGARRRLPAPPWGTGAPR